MHGPGKRNHSTFSCSYGAGPYRRSEGLVTILLQLNTMLTNRLSRTFPSPTYATSHLDDRARLGKDSLRTRCQAPYFGFGYMEISSKACEDISHCGSCYIMLHFRLITNCSQDVNLPTCPFSFYPVVKAEQFEVATLPIRYGANMKV